MSEPTRVTHRLGFHFEDLSDFEFKLVVTGKPVVLKNSKKIITIGGRPSIVSNAKASHYLREAAEQLAVQWRSVFREAIPLHVEVNAAIVTYLPTRAKPDASNLYQAVEDAMKGHTPHCKPKCDKHAGVIVDDVQIRTHDGSDRRYDPDNPRVEVTISPCRRPPFEPQLRFLKQDHPPAVAEQLEF